MSALHSICDPLWISLAFRKLANYSLILDLCERRPEQLYCLFSSVLYMVVQVL